MAKFDCSKATYCTGLLCYNRNNDNYCIVLDGSKGREDDKSALVIEFDATNTFYNQVPNRALIPTGRYIDLPKLLREEVEREITYYVEVH